MGPWADDDTADRGIVSRCLAGDAAAWDRLIERYQSFIYGIALRSGLSAADADDAFQNVCLKLCTHLQELRDADRIKAWLGAVTRQECLRLLRRRSTASLEVLADVSSDQDSPEDAVVRTERLLHLRIAMAALSPECRELLNRLYGAEDTSYATIAEEMGMPIGSIGPRRARCLERLRKKLETRGF